MGRRSIRIGRISGARLRERWAEAGGVVGERLGSVKEPAVQPERTGHAPVVPAQPWSRRSQGQAASDLRRQVSDDLPLAEAEGIAGVVAARVAVVAIRRLEASIRDMRVKGFEFDTCGAGCRVRVEVDLPATDLAGAHRQAMLVVRGDLERTAGLRVDAVDIVVGRLLPSGK